MATPEAEAFWYEHCTPDQEALVAKFAAELERGGAVVPDQLVLKRFLRARQWDVGQATSMYMAMQEYRRETKVEEIARSFVYEEEHAVQQCYPRFYHKTDRYGRPVYIELLGQCSVATLLQTTTMERFIKHHVKKWEHFEHVKLPACSAAAGKPIIGTVGIIDLDGLSITNFTVASKQFIQAVSRIDQDYYPEHLGALYVINAPFIFRSIWAFVKPLLDEGTAAKVQVLGAVYQEVLLAAIPADNLWTRYGGTSEVNEFKDVGPWTTDSSSKQPAASTAVVATAGAVPIS